MANINDRINGQEYESASPLAHAVRYDRAQVKTEEQKKQARENIGCFCEAGGGGSSGGGSSSGGGAFVVHSTYDETTDATTLDKTAAEIYEAFKTMPVIVVDVSENEGIEYCYQDSFFEAMLQDGQNYRFKTVAQVSSNSQSITVYYASDGNNYPTTQMPGPPSGPSA